MKNLTNILFSIMLLTLSNSSHAISVWVVESGSDPLSNAVSALSMSPGTVSLDLYYDLEGDTSYGYDFFLDIIGSAVISNVGGGDSDLGVSTTTGWRQLGGDFYGTTGSSILAFSFDFTADSGAILALNGFYTNANFIDVSIPEITLATVTAVPLPAAAWLFIGGLGLVGFSAKKKK